MVDSRPDNRRPAQADDDLRRAAGLPPAIHRRQDVRSEVPFLSTREGRRVMVFSVLFLVLVVFSVMFLNKAPPSSSTGPATEDVDPAPRDLLKLFDGSLANVTDGQDFGETFAYLKMLEVLSRTPPEEVTANVRRMLDYDAALADPLSWRGEYVRVKGIVPELKAVRILALEQGIDDVYRGTLTGTDVKQMKGVAIEVVGRPPSFKQGYDLVELDGVFFRTVKYEAKDGKVQEVPYVIARSLRVIPTGAGRSAGPHQRWILFGVVAFAVAFSALLVWWNSRPRPRIAARPNLSIREMFAMRMREEGIAPPRSSESKPPSGEPPKSAS